MNETQQPPTWAQGAQYVYTDGERTNLINTQAPATEAPPQQDRAYSITINQLDHGYTVNVGCKCFAIESRDKLIALLGNYLADPSGTHKAFFEKTLSLA
jgi:hypothetical protein